MPHDAEQRRRQRQGARLQQLRERAGYKDAADAARAMGVPVPTYQAHENGSRNLIKNASIYADFFGVDISSLTRDDNEPIESSSRFAPVMGPVGAGIWVEENLSKQSYPPVPSAPDYKEYQQVSFLLQPGRRRHVAEFAVCVPYWKVRGGFKNGDMVVTESRQGRLTERRLYRLKITADAAFLDPDEFGSGQQVKLPLGTTRADETKPKVAHLVIGWWSVEERS